MNHIDPYDLIRAIKTSSTTHAGKRRLKSTVGTVIIIGTAIILWIALG